MNPTSAIADLKANEIAQGLYRAGISNILSSGVLEIIRAMGQPTLYDHGTNTNVMASEAARTIGFNECLYLVEHFAQIYLEDTPQAQESRMDFNGLSSAVDKGLLTEEEAHAIRHNTSPKYDLSKLSNLGNIKPKHDVAKPPTST